MSKLRSINTAFWSDTWIEELDPNYKLLFLYLVTNDKTNMLGIYESSVRKISFETGLSVDIVNNGLKAFESIKKVKYVNNYIILVNYMKHQNYNTNMKKSAIDIYNNLPKELRNSKLTVSKSDPSKGFEILLNHYGMVRKVEDEDEVEDEIEVEDIFLYSESDFLKNWATCRKTFLKVPTHIPKLESYERVNFDKAKLTFTKDQINTALLGLFKQENKNIKTMYVKPKHFLENISKYLNAEMAKQYDLYGKADGKETKKGGL